MLSRPPAEKTISNLENELQSPFHIHIHHGNGMKSIHIPVENKDCVYFSLFMHTNLKLLQLQPARLPDLYTLPEIIYDTLLQIRLPDGCYSWSYGRRAKGDAEWHTEPRAHGNMLLSLLRCFALVSDSSQALLTHAWQ